jgi:hypothetical protein
MKKYIIFWGLLFSLTIVSAQEHTRFADLSLGITPEEMVQELEGKGMHRMMGVDISNTYQLSGRIAGLEVFLTVHFSKDSTRINHLMLTTRQQQGRSQRDDYSTLMQWMRKHYGAPTWESFVRSHAFARWYVGFDRDIVMISTAKTAVEIWFYDNHERRNFDYYAILKYCERNPVDHVPYMTAQECVTWKSLSTDSTAKKKTSKYSKASNKRSKHSKRHVRKASSRRGKSSKAGKRSRRRR